MDNTVCLVTGHLGYIGGHLYRELKRKGYQVHGFDLKDGYDARDYQRLLDVASSIGKIDYIFHLAAKPRVQESVENPSYTLSHNVWSTSCILQLARDKNVKKVIFSSSSAVYGNGMGPISPYGLHKLMSEMECKFYSEHFGVPTVCLRYFNVYSEDQTVDGPYCTVIANWMNAIRNSQDLLVYGDGSIKRDFIYIDDIVNANIECIKVDTEKNLVLDIGTGQSHSLNEIKDYVLSKRNVNFVHLPGKDCDPLETKAILSPADIFPWSARTPFDEGLRRCFG